MMIEEGLSVITVKKAELLDAVTKNRAAHRDVFLKAQDGYRAAVVRELDQMLKDAREGRRYCKVVQLEEPQDHTRDYDRIIRMLEMSVKAEVMITEREFSQYVLDDWQWKQQFVTTSSRYTG